MRVALVLPLMLLATACGGGDDTDGQGGSEPGSSLVGDTSAPSLSQVVITTDQGNLRAGTGFIRPAQAGAMATAGYLSLRSTGSDDALVAASAPGFGIVELHTVEGDGGVMRMRRVKAIPLPAGRTVDLEPGGYHLMMMRPEAALSEGDTVPVTLTFESGSTLTIDVPVERR